MRYNILKIILITNSIVIAMVFIYYAVEYANWDLLIITFCLWILSVIVMLFYNTIEKARKKAVNDLSIQLACIEIQARKMLEEKKKMIAAEKSYIITSGFSSKKEKIDVSQVSTSCADEQNEAGLTECEHNYKMYLQGHKSEN